MTPPVAGTDSPGEQNWARHSARNVVAVARLADDGSSGQVTALLRSDAFWFPTAVAVSCSRLLVVNAQLDSMGGHPRLPFTVVEVAATDAVTP